MIDLRVLKSRQLAAGVAFATFLGLALYGSVFVLPVFLQQLHGFTAWQTGKVILPGALASAFTMAIIAATPTASTPAIRSSPARCSFCSRCGSSRRTPVRGTCSGR